MKALTSRGLLSGGLFKQEVSPRGIKRFIQRKKVENTMENNKALLIGVGSLIIVAGVITAVYFARKSRKQKQNQMPPRNAPQLNVNNPGTQNEFVGAPRESEVG